MWTTFPISIHLLTNVVENSLYDPSTFWRWSSMFPACLRRASHMNISTPSTHPAYTIRTSLFLLPTCSKSCFSIRLTSRISFSLLAYTIFSFHCFPFTSKYNSNICWHIHELDGKIPIRFACLSREKVAGHDLSPFKDLSSCCQLVRPRHSQTR